MEAGAVAGRGRLQRCKDDCACAHWAMESTASGDSMSQQENSYAHLPGTGKQVMTKQLLLPWGVGGRVEYLNIG